MLIKLRHKNATHNAMLHSCAIKGAINGAYYLMYCFEIMRYLKNIKLAHIRRKSVGYAL